MTDDTKIDNANADHAASDLRKAAEIDAKALFNKPDDTDKEA